ncbi:MAG TPA: RecQ family ATP-dependent DNA helicase [Acidobacteriaceae bacterium]|nr:RecQ family ATP-dependent DNA helicase [Acidobacteriaceae bacterium]
MFQILIRRKLDTIRKLILAPTHTFQLATGEYHAKLVQRMDLLALLRKTFHHSGFRANQEAVCRAATEGRDVLLVMPTGAGKSLCYQLPAIARGGTALVISPLIALMDDQAAKLSALGLRVARIHSGLSREQSRQACVDYLNGDLAFLFIAPERLRVSNFPQTLARRKPALIAIDEAHCISAWGHDFRPDYRTLGDHLPTLRPAPVIALTATATPTVQRDIVNQLQLHDPALFIHGFRRDNLAIEVVEMSKPRRHEFAVELLREPKTRPAIVYAPSRKAAEELAGELNHSFGRQTAAAYHAGLEPATRERVQRAFQSGQLQVVVATIAFGMGIDKADVRTVIHTALPASVEAFYQEIGRAGRDGLPSRTVLLHSYADRKMHEFFFERDYPPLTDLDRVVRILPDDFTPPEPLAQAIKMVRDQFQKAVEKLIAQGAAQVDVAGNVRRTSSAARPNWRAGYESQLAFRRAQLDRMAAFAETPQCRMAALVQHFGDTADGFRPCGHCDFCAPESTTAQTFAAPTAEQARHLRSILSALGSAPSRSIGKLHGDLGIAVDRRTFDVFLDALARAGYVAITSDTFTNAEGNVIAYKKAGLTHDGRSDDAYKLTNVLLPSSSCAAAASPSSRSSRKGKSRPSAELIVPLTPAQEQLESKLRVWRKAEAAKTGKPAFIVVSDKVLRNIAVANPQTIGELLTISGIGPEKSDRYGADIVSICRGDAMCSPPAAAESGAPPRRASKHTKPQSAQLQSTPSVQSRQIETEAETFQRPVHVDHPGNQLSREQQLLDQRLRDWRKAESERVGAPPFLLLGSSALRAIVLSRPRTVAQLQSINGMTADAARTLGTAILEICNS